VPRLGQARGQPGRRHRRRWWSVPPRHSGQSRHPCRCAASARIGASWCHASPAATRQRRTASSQCCRPAGGRPRSAVRIARGEYQGCPRGVVRGAARHPSMAASENHTAKLPRWRRLASYSRQLITFRVCFGMGWRRSWFSLKGKVGIRGQRKGNPPTSAWLVVLQSLRRAVSGPSRRWIRQRRRTVRRRRSPGPACRVRRSSVPAPSSPSPSPRSLPGFAAPSRSCRSQAPV
jgi:hypothetical protein